MLNKLAAALMMETGTFCSDPRSWEALMAANVPVGQISEDEPTPRGTGTRQTCRGLPAGSCSKNPPATSGQSVLQARDLWYAKIMFLKQICYGKGTT